MCLNCVTLAKLWSTPALDHAHAVRLRQLAHLVVEARDPAPDVADVRLFPRLSLKINYSETMGMGPTLAHVLVNSCRSMNMTVWSGSWTDTNVVTRCTLLFRCDPIRSRFLTSLLVRGMPAPMVVAL